MYILYTKTTGDTLQSTVLDWLGRFYGMGGTAIPANGPVCLELMNLFVKIAVGVGGIWYVK